MDNCVASQSDSTFPWCEALVGDSGHDPNGYTVAITEAKTVTHVVAITVTHACFTVGRSCIARLQHMHVSYIARM